MHASLAQLVFCMTVTAVVLCFASKMSLTANLFTWT